MRRLLFVYILVVLGTVFYADSQNTGLLPKEAFSFISVNDGQEINLDTDIKLLSKTLGNPKTSSEVLNEIKFKKNSWDGLDIYVSPSTGISQIITIVNRNFSTIEGIKIGSDKVEIIDKLGQPARSSESFIRYYYSTMYETWNLVFFLNKEKVSSIQIHRLD